MTEMDYLFQNWVSDVPELAGNKLNSRSGCKQSERAKAEAAVQLRKELEAKVVVVPPGSEGKSATCRICMEDIPIEFDEDEEQWVWRNAVMQGEKVCSDLSGTLLLLKQDIIGVSRHVPLRYLQKAGV